MARLLRPLVALHLFSLLLLNISATTMTFNNKCPFTIWPGILWNPGKPVLSGGGFVLPSEGSFFLKLPEQWSGRFWPRTECNFDESGHGHCGTGDCGGNLYCDGIGGTPPATLVQITLGNDQDYYDVSLVDGYNVPISIKPYQGSGKCENLGCVRDLNMMCPQELQVMSKDKKYVMACKSPCLAFNLPMYCCTGEYGKAEKCKPTNYSQIFKSACPKAYSYAFDDINTLSTCTRAEYLVTFCP